MSIKIAICDDEEIIRKQLGNVISSYLSSKQIDFEIYYYVFGIDLLESSEYVDFFSIFLDINLGEYSGIEIAKFIRKKQCKPVNIIFITSYIEYQTEVISLHIFDYLVKPISNDRIYRVLDDLIFWYNKEGNKQKKRVRFKTINGLITVFIDDILYFEYYNRRVDIVTKDTVYHMYDKIKNVCIEMEKYDFASPHIAYVVNLNEINKFLKSENRIIMTNKKSIFISQLRVKQFRKKYLEFVDKIQNKEAK